MAKGEIFVGRKEELEAFAKVLERPEGEAVLVVGQAGMGKTWLVNRMARLAEEHPDLKCGWVRYEVTPTDSVDSTMAIMMDNAFEAARTEPGSFDNVPQRRKQWIALLKTVVPKGGEIAELIESLRRNPAKNTREQFLERLGLISKRMPENGRAVFIIDPEKYMQKDSDQSWAIVVKELPEKVKLVFPQRPEDVLVGSETLDVLDNVVCIPDKDLDVLDEKAVDELLDRRSGDLECSVTDLRKVLSRYKGHPYAIGAALDLVEAGTELKELPKKPEPIKFAEKQWEKLSKRGKDAIRLFKAYAILEVAVPDEVVGGVSEVDSDGLQSLLADKYLGGLLREEGEGKRIYHAILADCILGQIGEKEKQEYHERAVEVYRAKLAKAEKEHVKPDELAATRLAEHVLAAEGKEAFVNVCAYETFKPLKTLGLLDSAINLAQRALEVAKRSSPDEAAVRCTLGLAHGIRGDLKEAENMHLEALKIEKRGRRERGMAREYGNLGLIYRTRGELDKAEEMHKKALEIDEKFGNQEGMAGQYGNLGLIYETRGELDKAEEMHKKSLEIKEKLGLHEGMANSYGNLGNVYLIRGKLDKAEEMYQKALGINEKLGNQEGMATDYGNLGLIYMNRGELERAEEMHRKALEIDEKINHLEGVARHSANLGLIYEKRGDVRKAREYWERALELFKRIGMQPEIKQVEGWIEEIK